MIAPESITVAEEESATFNCTVMGSSDEPGWIINSSYYSPEALLHDILPRYSLFNHMLTLSNVNLLDNGTTYHCIILPFASDVAMLMVVPKGL